MDFCHVAAGKGALRWICVHAFFLVLYPLSFIVALISRIPSDLEVQHALNTPLMFVVFHTRRTFDAYHSTTIYNL